MYLLDRQSGSSSGYMISHQVFGTSDVSIGVMELRSIDHFHVQKGTFLKIGWPGNA